MAPRWGLRRAVSQVGRTASVLNALLACCTSTNRTHATRSATRCLDTNPQPHHNNSYRGPLLWWVPGSAAAPEQRAGLLSEKGPQQTFNYRLARGLLSSDSFGNLHSY
jgi:hypothetical protein